MHRSLKHERHTRVLDNAGRSLGGCMVDRTIFDGVIRAIIALVTLLLGGYADAHGVIPTQPQTVPGYTNGTYPECGITTTPGALFQCVGDWLTIKPSSGNHSGSLWSVTKVVEVALAPDATPADATYGSGTWKVTWTCTNSGGGYQPSECGWGFSEDSYNAVVVYNTTTTTYDCPALSQTSSAGCICDKGKRPNAGATACVAYSCMPAGSYDAITRPDVEVTSADTHQCIAGCQVVANSVTPSPDGKLWAKWPFKSMGVEQTCGGGSPTSPLSTPVKAQDTTGSSTGTEAPLPCLAGQYAGQVNGANKCIDAVGGEQVTSKDTIAPDGTIQRETTHCVSGSCTTTKETVNPDGSVTAVGTVIGATGVGAPGATDGSGSGKGGAGDGVGDCEGDDEAKAKCAELGTVEAVPVENKDPPLAITPSASMGPSAGGCPAPRTAAIMGQTFSFSWQPFCDVANGIRPVVVGLAWVTAIFGFMGIGRKD